MSKKFTIYIGSQDNTGLLDVSVRRNDFTFVFEFTRTTIGAFSISNFNPLIHKLSSIIYQAGCDALWDGDGSGQFFTGSNAGVGRDDTFQLGGWIEIEEFAYECLA